MANTWPIHGQYMGNHCRASNQLYISDRNIGTALDKEYKIYILFLFFDKLYRNIKGDCLFSLSLSLSHGELNCCLLSVISSTFQYLCFFGSFNPTLGLAKYNKPHVYIQLLRCKNSICSGSCRSRKLLIIIIR
jgi:hypothetical protein